MQTPDGRCSDKPEVQRTLHFKFLMVAPRQSPPEVHESACDLLPALDKSLHHHHHHEGHLKGRITPSLQNAYVCISSSPVLAHLGSLTRYMVIPVLQISGGSERVWFPGGAQWEQGTQSQDPAFSPLPKVIPVISITLSDLGDRTPNKGHLNLRVYIRISDSHENPHLRDWDFIYMDLTVPHRQARARCITALHMVSGLLWQRKQMFPFVFPGHP